jgi:hypothetical protein
MVYDLPIRLTHEEKTHILPRERNPTTSPNEFRHLGKDMNNIEQIPTTCTNQSKTCDCLGINEQNKIMDQLAKMLASQLHYRRRRMQN